MSTIYEYKRNSMRDLWKAIKGMMLIVAAFVAALVLFNLCTYTVGESEQAIVFRFGKINHIVLDPAFKEQYPDLMKTMAEGNEIRAEYGKGLRFKFPFVDSVTKYDSWLLTYISQVEDVNTKDKNKYQITMYAQWRVANPALFYMKIQTTDRASQYFDNTIYPILIQRINQLEATNFLSNKDMLNESLKEALGAMNKIVKAAGIVVADVQVNRTLLPDANLQSTYERMVANRQMEAQKYRSEGEEAYQNAVSNADLDASKKVADAITNSKKTMGEADARALEIYANSFSKDAEFYGYWRTLQMMKNTLNGSTIVLNEKMPIWKDLLNLIAQGKVEVK